MQYSEAVCDRATRYIAGIGVSLEFVPHTGAEVEFDCHSGAPEPLGVGEVLITEDVASAWSSNQSRSSLNATLDLLLGCSAALTLRRRDGC
jgi:hypothetical protein